MAKGDGEKPVRDGEPNGGGASTVRSLDEHRKAEEEAPKGGGGVAAKTEQTALDDPGEPGESGDQTELFVWEHGRKVTLGNLIAKNVPVEHAFVFGGKRADGRGGLMALDEQPVLVVRGMAGRVVVVPTHDDDGKVTKVVIENHVAAQRVMPADSEEAVALVGPIIDARRSAQADAASG